MRILGLDPGLRRTGWGVVDTSGPRLRFVAAGMVVTDPAAALAGRLVQLADGLTAVVAEHAPDAAAVEETFVNRNPASTLKLGQARGIALLIPARHGVAVFEYTPNQVKKTVVGTGHAAKEQIQMMVRALLPGAAFGGADAADALAVAICHAHQRPAPGVAAAGVGR